MIYNFRMLIQYFILYCEYQVWHSMLEVGNDYVILPADSFEN